MMNTTTTASKNRKEARTPSHTYTMSDRPPKSSPYRGILRRFQSDSDERRPSYALQQQKLWKRFTPKQSTEELHKTKSELYTGVFGQIRKQLDYKYHSHYRKERQWLHDAVIEDVSLEREETDSKLVLDAPWLILLVGTREASKHSFVKELVDNNRLRLQGFVTVDPDDIRGYLPEYVSYNAEYSDRVEELTRAETAYIAETLVRASLSAAHNVLWHGVFTDVQWLQNVFLPMARAEYNCKIAVWLVNNFEEAQALEKQANVRVSATLRQAERTALKLRESASFFCQLTQGRDEQIQLKGCGFWKTFEGTFDQRAPKLDYIAPRCMQGYRRQSLRFRRMSLLRSSEENNKSDDMNFYGQFANIRATLDYSYHCNYTHERQKFQDSIVREYLEAAVIEDKNGEVCTTPTEPWIVFTAGAMGAGKGYTMRRLVTTGRFPLMAFVRVDPDAIRRLLPEYSLYVHNNPEMAGELTNKEAGYIAEILTLAGLLAGKNVMVDGSLRRSAWYKDYFKRLRRDFPKLRIAIIHVTAPRQAIFQRAAERAIQTGRIVPKKLLEDTLEEVPRSVKELEPLADYHIELHNAPDAADIIPMTPGEEWDSFTSQWIQTCAWIPKSTKRLKEKSRKIEQRLISASEN